MVQPFAAAVLALLTAASCVAANSVPHEPTARRGLRDSAYATAYAAASSSGGDSQAWASATGDGSASAYSYSSSGTDGSTGSTQPSSGDGTTWQGNRDAPQVLNSFNSGNQGDASPSTGDTSSGFAAPQPAQPSSGSSGATAGYAQEALDKHNYYRARHGSQALTWSSQLESDAAAWASGCAFQHSGVNGQGENLAWGYDSISTVIDAFYDEVKLYTYGESDPGNFEEVGHFTQLVWRATTEVGCAISQCGSQRYDVCRYSPPGNVAGQYAQQVYPPTSSRHFMH